jgi:hypothetical protein
MLHAYGYFIVDTEAAKEPDNVWRVALVKHLQFTHNLITNSWFDVQHDHLERKGGGRKRERKEGRKGRRRDTGRGGKRERGRGREQLHNY